MAQQYPREEHVICQGLISELIQAQTWAEVVQVTRALLNVRALGERERQNMQRGPVGQGQTQSGMVPPQGESQPPPQNYGNPETTGGLPWED